MKRKPPAENPDAYVTQLTGWRHDLVVRLRKAVKAAAAMEEIIKWGHLVYTLNGPVLLIRAEEERVLFGFWHGKHLTELEPRLKPSGKYDMATVEFREGMTITPATIRRLVQGAAELNQTLGDPTKAAPARKRTRQTE